MRIYQVRDALSEACALVSRRPGHLVERADPAVGVRKQAEPELLRLRESLVVLGGVEGCAEDDAIGFRQISGPVTQAPALGRSARGRGLGVPPEEDPMAPLIRQ